MGTGKQCDLDRYTSDLIRIKARRLIGNYGFIRDDLEDLVQDITLDVLERLPKYDASRASLRTFIDRIVSHKITDIIRNRHRLKRDYRRNAWSVDEEVTTEDGHVAARGDGMSQESFDREMGRDSRPAIGHIDMCVDIARAIHAMPSDLHLAAVLLMETSKSEAAEVLGVPRGTLYGRELVQLRARFLDKGLREYL